MECSVLTDRLNGLAPNRTIGIRCMNDQWELFVRNANTSFSSKELTDRAEPTRVDFSNHL
jgi:hypothetical protein